MATVFFISSSFFLYFVCSFEYRFVLLLWRPPVVAVLAVKCALIRGGREIRWIL